MCLCQAFVLVFGFFMHASHDALHITLSAHVAGEMQNVQITQQTLSAS